MSRASAGLPLPASRDGRFLGVPPQERDPRLRSLVAAAIAIGRMPGEPAAVLHAVKRHGLLANLFGGKGHGPLADPRLEVVRAISASLSRGVGAIRGDLVSAAVKVGWSGDDLGEMFPAASFRVQP